jgi:autotransporter-associated beta strand protein
MTHVVKRSGWWCGVLTIAALMALAPRAAAASTYRWQNDASGVWNVSGNWELVEGPAGVGYPNLPGDVAVFDEPLTAARTVIITDTVTITIGRLTVAQSPAPGVLTIANAGTGLLAFDNLGEDAVIESSGTGEPVNLATPIQLAADATVDGRFTFFADIGETGGARNMTISGGSITNTGRIAYTGTTTVANGALTAGPSLTPGLGTLVVGDGTGAPGSASVSVIGDAMDHSAAVTVRVDGSITFGPDVGFQGTAIGTLTVEGGTVTVEQLPVRVGIVGDLTMQGGFINIGPYANVEYGMHLGGSVTATSTAAGPAVIAGGALYLYSGSTAFTVADGPQGIDLRMDAFMFDSYRNPTTVNVTKLGAGVMQMSGARYRGTTQVAAGELIAGPVGPQAGAFTVGANAVLSGAGPVAPGVTVQANGTLSPGRTAVVGTMGSGAVALAADAHFVVDIPAIASFDRLNVTGTVALGHATLDVTSASSFPPGARFTIIDNDGIDPVTGTFAGLPEGASFTTTSGVVFQITYQGGSGNDVVLTNVAPFTYFLSEGATGTFFDEDVLIANPNSATAPITMTFLLPGGGTVVRQATVPAQARLTVHVDELDELENTSASVEVRSDNGLTLGVERTMFWDSTHYGGHTANAVSRPEPQWIFAEGAQNGFFDTYLLLANPGAAVTAKVTFLREGEPPFVLDVPLQAQSRQTVYAGDHAQLVGRSFGMVVEAPTAITAERAMYFATTPQRLWNGGHDNVGSPAPATSWYHPEGASGTFFSTFILMSNPQTTPANVTLRFLLPLGAPIEITKTIAPQQRITVNPADEGIVGLQNAAFSTVVTSNVPIVSERAMYWNGDDTTFGEGHASSGLTERALDWVLAEGRVGGANAYTTYVLLANPSTLASSVTVTFLRESGAPVVKTYQVAPNSRFNIDVGTMVPELQNESFGTLIQVTAGEPIAVERSMYWNVEGRFWSGGTNAVGTIVPR